MNSARARALARATSKKLGADGHVVNEDGDLVLLMAKWHRLEDMSHRRLERLRPIAWPHGERIPQVLTLGHCEREQLGSTFGHGHVMKTEIEVECGDPPATTHASQQFPDVRHREMTTLRPTIECTVIDDHATVFFAFLFYNEPR